MQSIILCLIFVHLVVPVVDDQIATLGRSRRVVLVIHVEGLLRVLLVVSNLFHGGIPADDGLVVSRASVTPGHGHRAASVISRDLIPDRGNSLFARVRTGLVIGAPAPTDMSYIHGTYRARKPKPVVLPHDMVQLTVIFRWEVDVFIVPPWRSARGTYGTSPALSQRSSTASGKCLQSSCPCRVWSDRPAPAAASATNIYTRGSVFGVEAYHTPGNVFHAVRKKTITCVVS